MVQREGLARAKQENPRRVQSDDVTTAGPVAVMDSWMEAVLSVAKRGDQDDAAERQHDSTHRLVEVSEQRGRFQTEIDGGLGAIDCCSFDWEGIMRRTCRPFTRDSFHSLQL